jgi:hypothetical protein
MRPTYRYLVVALESGIRPECNTCSKDPSYGPDGVFNAHLGNPGESSAQPSEELSPAPSETTSPHRSGREDSEAC